MAKYIRNLKPTIDERPLPLSENDAKAWLEWMVEEGMMDKVHDNAFKLNAKGILVQEAASKIGDLMKAKGPMTLDQIKAALPETPEHLIIRVLELFGKSVA